MSTCQLAGNVLLFLTRGNRAIREWRHDLFACLRSLVVARMCSIAGFHGMSSSNEFFPSRHCRFCKKKKKKKKNLTLPISRWRANVMKIAPMNLRRFYTRLNTYRNLINFSTTTRTKKEVSIERKRRRPWEIY